MGKNRKALRFNLQNKKSILWQEAWKGGLLKEGRKEGLCRFPDRTQSHIILQISNHINHQNSFKMAFEYVFFTSAII